MASGSLGTLTLDLAVRLSEFTDGLTQAERQARDSASNISDSVGNLRDSIAEDMSKISGSFIGMAIGGAVVAAGALAAVAIETAKADVQLGIMAGTANSSLKSFQVLTHAAAGFGVEQEALAAILADTQEKLGEFSATGGGGAADFFETLQNNTKMTDEEIRNLGKTLQSKDGVGAIQYLKDELDALGATSQEQRFIMESLAGDLGNLMPLFANGGAILEEYGIQLEDAGVIKTQEAIEQSRRLAAQTQAIQTQFEGLKTQLVAEMIPALGTLINHFTEGTTKGRGFKNEVNGVGSAVQITAASLVGLAAGVSIIAEAFQQVGSQMRNIGETSQAFFSADGVIAKGKTLAVGFVKTGVIAADGYMSVTDKYEKAIKTIDTLMSGQQKKLTGLAATYYDTNTFLQSHSDGLAINTVEATENAKALDKRSAALKKAQKVAGETKLTPNKASLANAEKYGFAGYEAQYGLPYGLLTGIHMQETQGHTTGPKATGPMTKYGKAKGGFQLIDDTAKRFQVGNPYDMTQATEGAAKYLSWLLKRFDGDLAKAVAAYNTGEGNIDKHPMSLILSDRWARDKKTGVGQTKQYTKNVLGYMQGVTSETGKIIYDSMVEQDKETLKRQEDTLRRQGSIQAKYASEREKLDREYAADITEIETLYAEGSIERTDLLNRAKIEYDEKRTATAKSILESYMKGEERLTYEHKQAIERINTAFAEDDPTRQMLIDLQKAAYQEDLDNFRFAAGEKAREQDKLYQSLANSMRANSNQAASDGLDRMAQRTMSSQDYEVWRLAQDHDEAFNSVNSQYSDRQSEINKKDERGNFELPELERFELLELAKQEHIDNMWAMDQDYALKEKTLSDQMQDAKLQNYGNTMGAMAGLLGAFAGENNRVSQMMFAAQKGFALAQIFMNNKVALSEAWASAPFPYNVPAVAMAALETGALAAAAQAITPSFSGIAHGGLDYVPKEQTYLLDKGERVLSPNQNKDFTNFMQGNQTSGGGVGEINIVVSVDAKGNSSMTGDTADNLGRVMAKQVEQTARNVVRKELMQGGMIDKRLRR